MRSDIPRVSGVKMVVHRLLRSCSMATGYLCSCLRCSYLLWLTSCHTTTFWMLQSPSSQWR